MSPSDSPTRELVSKFHIRLIWACSFAVSAGTVAAQSPVPIRELAPTTATATRTFGLILNVRALADGKVLVNDGGNRQLMVLDSSLSNAVVLLDSAAGTTASYGPRASPLIQYLGDSALFVDGPSLSLLLITPSGVPGRVIAAPKAAVVRSLSASSSGVDRTGNLIYRTDLLADERPITPGSTTIVMTTPDSVAIARANFDTRIVDTIARLKVSNSIRLESTRSGDTLRMHRIMNPVSFADEWAVLADGSMALVRGHDYHIDWIRPDGTKTSTPKLPFDWKKLTDADKHALMDSVRNVFEKTMADAAARRPATGEGGRRRPTEINTIEFVPLSQIGDYQPPIRTGAVKPDLDNNLWILPATSAQSRSGELVYDVVNRDGRLTHRVRIPVGHSIAGFGHNGVVFLMAREGGSWVLKRTRVVGDRNS